VISGYYSEIGYNILENNKITTELIPFVRFENYNTHNETDGDLLINDSYNRTDLTFGIGYKVSKGAMFKADYQIKSDKGSDGKTYQLNLGTAIWF
ncbi:MAG: hypothetical protein HOA52_00225, partial [Flavobacteriales bacterium]|nr:hypothetical protein [Flavobacteriales bacterium]